MVQSMSSLRKDFCVSQLRSQLSTLTSVLGNMEDSSGFEDDYVDASLKQVEKNLKQLRKIISN